MDRFMYMIENSGLQFNQHQYDGVQFCISREQPNSNNEIQGGFIVDEMGLGKTITMIGTIFANYVGTTLIVVPPILINQWFNEIVKTTGHKSIVYHGPKKTKITEEMLTTARIVLTTYNGIQELKNKENPLHKIRWARVVFDEAHHLRNKTLSHKGSLLLNTEIRWLISGTPIQNSIRDFYNLCLAAGISKEFFSKKENHKIILEKFVLRRTKKQVGIQIPGVTIVNHCIPWATEKEQTIAEEIHAALQFSNVDSNKMSNLSNALESEGVLQLMLRARQMCVYPKLMEKKLRLLTSDGVIDSHYLESISETTSKLDKVIEVMAERKDNQTGKLVFCHYHREMDEIARRLMERGFQNVVTFDGRITKKSKDAILQSENTDTVLILQIQTGCEGLNLQDKYSEVYFVSPHWNPSVEEQAIARCHRIGQKKEVTVFRFIMTGFNGMNLNNLNQNNYNGENIYYGEDQCEEEMPEDEEITRSLDEHIAKVQTNKKDIINAMFI